VEHFSLSQPKQDGLVFQAPGRERRRFGGGELPRTIPLRQAEQKSAADASQDVETVKRPKRIVSSLVWFESFDRNSLCLRQPLFAFDAYQRIDELADGAKYWKMRVGVRIVALRLASAAAIRSRLLRNELMIAPTQALKVSGKG
jgi:hypothetical protein